MNKTGSQLEKIRLQLLDLGLRGNTMLHFAPRGTKNVSVKARIDKELAVSTAGFELESKKQDLAVGPEISRVKLAHTKPEPELYCVTDLSQFDNLSSYPATSCFPVG